MLQIQEFNAALFTFKCCKVNVVKKLSRLFSYFFPFFDKKSGELERQGLEAELRRRRLLCDQLLILSLEISYCKSYNN